MKQDTLPDWLTELDSEDITFMRNFILSSGSLKEIAVLYGVTYPTVRLRLDRLIQRIQVSNEQGNDPYVAMIKRMAINEKIDLDTAKVLISEYRKTKKVGE
ncbi:MAG: hypothetical protein A2Y20_09480 [Firmicutes bacterium GWF2_51_9]|nr:DUF2089 family protein [Erysipelotrichaceae bacterium]OGS54536.1 MAG: hypothetical protein A2Y20_09480 [Firmicutes bacterium GWF2_51_9]OGS57320.1 MAG: hypothetical protein A2Y19_02300 [Firmicutes bacterium GWE2_51_13]HAM62544.1 hypothetical protein [Erysipelotrichaceae bacterium]HAO61218.1 hypothetical protein [Erysipelotrichaceae bacterium]